MINALMLKNAFHIETNADGALTSKTDETHAVHIRRLSNRQWDDAMENFKDVIHEQTSCFNELKWRKEQLERLMVFRGDQMIGGAIVRKIQIPMTGKTLAVVRWGPVWRRFDAPVDVSDLRTVHRELATELSDRQGCFVLHIPRADPENCDQELRALDELGYKAGFQPESPERYFVRVDKDLDAMRASFAQKWRYNLKKAEKAGLEAVIDSGPQGLKDFFDLYSNMVSRKKFFETSPIDTLRYLMGVEHKKLRPEILIVKKNGEPIAGAVLDLSGDQAIYLYGATNERALGLKAGYFMQWEILKHLSKLPNIRWYALGGGTSDHCSLHQFKRGLVGKTGVVNNVPAYHYLASSGSTEAIGRLAVYLQLTKGIIQKSLHDKISSVL